MRFEIKRAKNGYIIQCDTDEEPFVFQELSEEIMDEVDCWVYFLRELTRSLIMEIPGVRDYDVFRNDSKYVPENISGFGVEIIFENQKALDVFMEHPKHFEANALFEKYLADPPYMVLTHEI